MFWTNSATQNNKDVFGFAFRELRVKVRLFSLRMQTKFLVIYKLNCGNGAWCLNLIFFVTCQTLLVTNLEQAQGTIVR